MKTVLSFVPAVLLCTLPTPASAQVILTADLGNVTLAPGLADQVRTFTVQNTGSTSLENILGLNFVMQIGDGSAGPKIQSVSLSAGDSIFSGNVAAQDNLGGTSWTVYYALEANTPVSLASASPATLLAQVTFDTTDILSSGTWPISLKNVEIQGNPFSSEYVLGAGAPHTIDTIVNGSLTVVPEPGQIAGAAGVLLGMFALSRRAFRHARMSRGSVSI